MLSAADQLAVGFLDEHLDPLADPGLRALLDKRIHDVAEMIPALRYLPRRQLAVEAGSLGPVLVGVAENPDGVQARRGEKLLEDLDVGLGLAREAANDVAPDARTGRPLPDGVEQIRGTGRRYRTGAFDAALVPMRVETTGRSRARPPMFRS